MQCPPISYVDVFNGFCNVENEPLKKVNWENRNLRIKEKVIAELLVNKYPFQKQ
jgi:hypothetical protein